MQKKVILKSYRQFFFAICVVYLYLDRHSADKFQRSQVLTKYFYFIIWIDSSTLSICWLVLWVMHIARFKCMHSISQLSFEGVIYDLVINNSMNLTLEALLSAFEVAIINSLWKRQFMFSLFRYANKVTFQVGINQFHDSERFGNSLMQVILLCYC